MNTEQSLTCIDKITTYNFLEETCSTNRLLIFFINKFTKTSAKLWAKNQKTFNDGEVNNVCSVAPPNKTGQKVWSKHCCSALKKRFRSQWWRHNSARKACSAITWAKGVRQCLENPTQKLTGDPSIERDCSKEHPNCTQKWGLTGGAANFHPTPPPRLEDIDCRNHPFTTHQLQRGKMRKDVQGAFFKNVWNISHNNCRMKFCTSLSSHSSLGRPVSDEIGEIMEQVYKLMENDDCHFFFDKLTSTLTDYVPHTKTIKKEFKENMVME